MSDAPVKVLSIMARGRSGSTILDNALNGIDGFFSIGELHNLWRRGLIQAGKCGCGAEVANCDIWQKVLSAALQDPSDFNRSAEELIAWQSRSVQTRYTRKLLNLVDDPSAAWDELRHYADVVGTIYRELARVTGARVIIDSSKRPSDAAMTALLPGVEAYFVHLVRDPRAVAYSRQRKKQNVDREMKTWGPAYSTIGWARRNLAAEMVTRRFPNRSLLVRYEDFVQNPAGTIGEIARLVDPSVAELPAIHDHTITLGENHTVAGNPSRFKHGDIELRLDSEWRNGQRRSHRLIATTLALPLIRRYGYGVSSAPVNER
jgi:hypothetical protein